MSLKIYTFVLGNLMTNCYMAVKDKAAIVIDPADKAEKIIREADEKDLKIEKILLTHGHFDHIIALDELAQATGAHVYIGSEDSTLLNNAKENGSLDFFEPFEAYKKPDYLLYDNDEIDFHGEKIKVMSTKGHTQGSLCYVCDADKVIFSGDTLFYESYGRCDLFGGSEDDMKESLEKLRRLYKEHGDYIVYTGHGRKTTLSHEFY